MLSCFQLCFPISQLCCVYDQFRYVMLQLFECVASKWDRPIDPETPARGEMSSIFQAVQAIHYAVEVDEFEGQRSRDPCLKQPANDVSQVECLDGV